MNRNNQTILFLSGFLAIVSPGLLLAQAPPGPLRPTQAPPPVQSPATSKEQSPQKAEQPLPPRDKRDLSGSWKLNRDESDDPRKKMEEARGGNGGGGTPGGRRSGGGYPGGGYPGGGYPGGGHGTYGGRGRGMGGEQSDQDRQRMQDVFTPADSLIIAQKNAEIDLTDDRNRKRVFYTDGRKLQKSKDANYQEFSAKWNDDRLVSEDKSSSSRKITRTYELAEGGQYLYETIHMESGNSRAGIYLRYVYNFVR